MWKYIICIYDFLTSATFDLPILWWNGPPPCVWFCILSHLLHGPASTMTSSLQMWPLSPATLWWRGTRSHSIASSPSCWSHWNFSLLVLPKQMCSKKMKMHVYWIWKIFEPNDFRIKHWDLLKLPKRYESKPPTDQDLLTGVGFAAVPYFWAMCTVLY